MTTPTSFTPSGPYTPDGSNRAWDFDFKVTAADQLVLILVDSAGVETEVTSGFTVPTSDIGSDNGGTVTYPVAPTDPLEYADYVEVYVTRAVDLGQPNKIGNQGGFYPQTHEETFDLLAMQVQQVNERVNRAAVVPVSASAADLEGLIADILLLADLDTELAALGAITANISTVAGISGDVTAVAGIAANVTTVAGIQANVSTVAGVAANVTTVAGIAANVTTVAGLNTEIPVLAALNTELAALGAISADISTVAGVAANVTTVAGIAANVTTVAGINAAVSAVAAIDTEVAAVYAIGAQIVALEAVDAEIAALGPYAANIGTVATNIADVNTVAANIATISAKVSKSGDTMSGDLDMNGSLVQRMPAMKGSIDGLELANNVVDATNDIDVAAGFCASDDDDPYIMVLTASITKRLDAAWAVGTGNGGLDTGAVGNGTYHVFLIQRSDTGVVDVLFSNSATAPTMPTNYDRKRRIGSIVRLAGALQAFKQIGDYFFRSTGYGEFASTSPGTSLQTTALAAIPSGISVLALLAAAINHGVSGYTNHRFGISGYDETPISSEFGFYGLISSELTATQLFWGLKTSTSAQIKWILDQSDANITFRVRSYGWIDTRGRG